MTHFALPVVTKSRIVLLTKYVSLGSVLALAILSSILFLTEGYAVGLWMLAFFGLSLFRHRKNVAALLRGEERKTDLIEAFKRKRN
jgi:glycerol-3-phosphate acyltransferase PlsY